MRFQLSVLCLLVTGLASSLHAADPAFPARAKRILFLGDSITYAGQYINFIETQLRLAGVDPLPEIINLGLSSETVCGLSEPTHPFPRPGVHERLDRALAEVQPDVVVACYGMNDGIYAPLSEERFAAFRDGYDKLIEKVHASGAKLVLMTPPPFDPVPVRAKGKLRSSQDGNFDWRGIYENYNDEVLTPYADWVKQQADRVEMVIDLHTAVEDFLAEQRKSDPGYSVAGDGVHPNATGHQVIAETILDAWNIEQTPDVDPELLKLVSQRQNLLKLAWLNEVGHKRPGVPKGLPLDEARKQAAELEAKIVESMPQHTGTR